MVRRQSRTWMTFGTGAAIALALGYAFWPRPQAVDLGMVERTSMVVTIDEEARTRVRDAYVVSSPIAGRLMRVEVRPGDVAEGGQSVVARMLPINPPALDARTREQARSAANAAEAALLAARADLKRAMAEREFAEQELKRKRQLQGRGISSEVALDEAMRSSRAAAAAVDVAKATIAMREADLANARAQLITFSSVGAAQDGTAPSQLGMSDVANTVPVTAPVSGRILRVFQESETTVAAGTAILEIGDITNDLEVVVELLSTDAVQIEAGNRVLIRKWGGEDILNGVVERVEPWGFTKVSALGVEEQRVKAIISFTDPPATRRSLGHGFRVETQIVIWESADALAVPSSALFRHEGDWAVFAVEGGSVRLKKLQIGRNNGVVAQVLEGIEAGAKVVLYPGPNLVDGANVTQRTVG